MLSAKARHMEEAGKCGQKVVLELMGKKELAQRTRLLG
jgi:hypothetical protein